MIAAVTQYMQSHVEVSLPLAIYRRATWFGRRRGSFSFITDWSSEDGQAEVVAMFEEAFGPNAFDMDDDDIVVLETQDGTTPWYVAMDDAFTNWKDFRSSSIAHKFTNLINVIVCAGMCTTSDLTFKVGNVALFSPIVSKKQVSSGDVFEAFYESVSGFMKGGWRVFQTGEVSAFFMEDDQITLFDNKYSSLIALHGYAIAGNLIKFAGIEDNEYEAKLLATIEEGTKILARIKRSQTYERKYLSDRVDQLRLNLTNFVQTRSRGGLRISPFSVSLYGQSGCGKSSLTSLTINAGLLYNGLNASKDRICSWADNDKFASNLRSHMNAIVFDDFANTKAVFTQVSPAYRLIQVINNMKSLAPMADLQLKGKVSYNPYFCLVSTNVEHLDAAVYSNEPESVLRRLYHVKVIPKPEFCESGTLSTALIFEKFGQDPAPDIWDLSIRRYKTSGKKSIDLEAMIPVIYRGKVMTNVSVGEYLDWVQVASKTHFEQQKEFIGSQEQESGLCDECGKCYCKCSNLGLKKEFLPESEKLVPHAGQFSSYSNRVYEPFIPPGEESEIVDPTFFQRKATALKEAYASAAITSIVAADQFCVWWSTLDFLPESLLCHPRVLRICLYFWREELRQSIFTGNCFIVMLGVFASIACPCFIVLWLLLTAGSVYFYMCATVQTFHILIRMRILNSKKVVSTYVSSWQAKYAIVSLGAVSIILLLMRSRYDTLNVQTGLDPQNIADINDRNDKVNPWIVPQVAPLPMQSPSRTTTSDNLAASMRTNLIGIVSDINKTTLGFYISSNFVVIPSHFVREHTGRDILVKCYKTGEDKVGSYFRDKISTAYTVAIPMTDFSISYMTSGGSMKDMRKFLPEDSTLKMCPAKFVTRDIMDTSLKAINMLYKGSTTVSHTQSNFPGSYYTLPIDTKNGMCMSPVISDARGAMIMGFHLGGKGRLGGCGTLTKDQVDLAMQELSRVDGVVLSASSGSLTPNMGDFPDSTFGKPIVEGTTIHQKSAVNFLKEGACIDIYGQVSGKATPYSSVTPTLISDTVASVFGVPQLWGPPKMKGKGNYPYQATLEHAAFPSLPQGSILVKAVGSIKSLTSNLKNRIPELFHTGPLSNVATVSGLTGKKFIDPMNFNSSPGFPLTGSKIPLLEDLDPDDYPECGKPRTFTAEVWKEYDKAVEILRKGDRCYMIWKSCLKDESTKLTQDKVRVFQSAPLVLQLIIRKYFLPLVRIIQMNPILYECAVGVNAEGPEWEQIWNAAMSKGKERVLAGDYSKYDVRMPAQVTIAAFDILIDIARQCDGYTTEDIHLMEMLVHEVVYPIMAYNGDLIQLFGTNPSGQNLTVIINSLVNSLLLRCSFFTIYPDKDFKENCAFATYGDDVLGTISEQCGKFTHISYAAYLAEHDMKFTMPDKESVPTEYMNEEDVDFLKRKCVFSPDLGIKIGQLSEDSIFKRLHSHLLSQELTMEMHSAQNIESSLHDWFYYGREVFEDRKAKLLLVAQKCEIEHLCPALTVSYDKRVNRWRHKYLGEELEETQTPVSLS